MIKIKSLLNEEHNGKTFISVDIQPDYIKFIGFKIHKFCKYLNENYNDFNNLIFLYNGESMGMTSDYNYKIWLIDNGLEESIIDSCLFYDKGYAFFRYCMDNGLSKETISNFIRFMYENGINDSRDMNRKMWAKYLREYRKIDRKEVYELLKQSNDLVNIPDLMEFLKKYKNIVLTGGGAEECLREVEIALLALKIPYELENEFVY